MSLVPQPSVVSFKRGSGKLGKEEGMGKIFCTGSDCVSRTVDVTHSVVAQGVVH